MKSALVIFRNYEMFEKDPIDGVSLGYEEENIYEWQITLIGPKDSPYEGGIFNCIMQFPKDYPLNPPTFIFKTKIYHPNINQSGNICLDILKDSWSPALNISKVLLSISSLLTDPNPDDPLVIDIAKQYRENISQYNSEARAWTLEFATSSQTQN